jgi:hypothetical protein
MMIVCLVCGPVMVVVGLVWGAKMFVFLFLWVPKFWGWRISLLGKNDSY